MKYFNILLVIAVMLAFAWAAEDTESLADGGDIPDTTTDSLAGVDKPDITTNEDIPDGSDAPKVAAQRMGGGYGRMMRGGMGMGRGRRSLGGGF